MAINSISEVVYSRVPWLASPADDVKVNGYISQTQIMLQIPLSKDDSVVFDESTYTQQELLLTGLYASYSLVENKAMQSSANSGNQQGNKIVKKAKADVTEVEFEILNKNNSFFVDAKTLMESLAEEICNLATTMKINLPLCRDRYKGYQPADVGVNFITSCGFRSCGC